METAEGVDAKATMIQTQLKLSCAYLPLDKHRDHCPAMSTIILYRFRSWSKVINIFKHHYDSQKGVVVFFACKFFSMKSIISFCFCSSSRIPNLHNTTPKTAINKGNITSWKSSFDALLFTAGIIIIFITSIKTSILKNNIEIIFVKSGISKYPFIIVPF